MGDCKFAMHSCNLFTGADPSAIFVCIHGAGYSSSSFAVCAKRIVELSSTSAVIAIDLRYIFAVNYEVKTDFNISLRMLGGMEGQVPRTKAWTLTC